MAQTAHGFTADTASLAVLGQAGRFRVRRVYCVGRNYAAHVREMGFDAGKEEPFFFCKPNDAESIVAAGPGDTVTIPYPAGTANFHFEAELVVAIGASGRDVSPQDAAGLVYGYAAGLDMTRRDLQMAARERGRPWETGKAFDFSAPVGPLTRAGAAGPLTRGAISLEQNGVRRQDSDLGLLVWPVADILAKLSASFALHPGDLVFTGTPDGVGPAVRGDLLRVRIDGLLDLSVRIA